MWLVAAIVLVVLAADQLLKFWVKTNMTLGEEIPMIGDWFKLHFTENDGMAFGIELPGTFGKLFLTLFRLVAVSGIIYYLLIQVRRGIDKSTVVLIALILAGALGNIIDSVFYGRWFNDLGLAEWSQNGNGYAKLFHGQVVDMFYFPLFSGTYPTWMPFKGGQSFTFFSAIFNIADAAISIGLFAILIFKRSLFNQLKEDVISDTSGSEKSNTSIENPISEAD
jgi:signal peptidase II